MNILFTCAGRRRYLLNYFKEIIGDSGKIIATDMQLSAPALTAADVKIQVPRVYTEDYIPTTLNICKEYKVDVLISLNDLELPILAERKYDFEAIGTKVIVSDSNVIDICFDKYRRGYTCVNSLCNHGFDFRTVVLRYPLDEETTVSDVIKYFSMIVNKLVDQRSENLSRK